MTCAATPSARAAGRDPAGFHRHIGDYLKSTEMVGKEANESIDILPAERRLARRNRGGHGCDAAGGPPPYVERDDRNRQTFPPPRLRFWELFKATPPQ